MAGREVTRTALDERSAEALMAIRDAFRKVDTIQEFLSNNPVANGVDPLTLPTTDNTDPMNPKPGPGKFGYTADEAYLIRLVFQQLTDLNAKSPLKLGRKLTGLD